ncbi:hypothetical protein M758_UG052500 [Ceratodon purpureus]|nr:hypothetical protein M758_UG052500 [Ceratodon purpureus]
MITDDIDRRFIFNPPLQEDYIFFYIENSMRTYRYLWRKYWVQTSKGQKHKFCPARFFPALVKYWRTAEAEEESRKMKEARAQAKKNKELRLASGALTSGDADDAWDPLLDEDEETSAWDKCDENEDLVQDDDTGPSPSYKNETFHVDAEEEPTPKDQEASLEETSWRNTRRGRQTTTGSGRTRIPSQLQSRTEVLHFQRCRTELGVHTLRGEWRRGHRNLQEEVARATATRWGHS